MYRMAGLWLCCYVYKPRLCVCVDMQAYPVMIGNINIEVELALLLIPSALKVRYAKNNKLKRPCKDCYQLNHNTNYNLIF